MGPKSATHCWYCSGSQAMMSSWRMYQKPKGISEMVSWVGNWAWQEEAARMVVTRRSTTSLPSLLELAQSISRRLWDSPKVMNRLSTGRHISKLPSDMYWCSTESRGRIF